MAHAVDYGEAGVGLEAQPMSLVDYFQEEKQPGDWTQPLRRCWGLAFRLPPTKHDADPTQLRERDNKSTADENLFAVQLPLGILNPTT